MKKVGIICEYNPLHRGHEKQIRMVKEQFSDAAVICLMSGNFVQRGHPAIMDKSLRAQAAVLAGADLVLELPVTCALSSAEGFAAGGVRILGKFCDYLCFGSETADANLLTRTASALLSPAFSPLLHAELNSGCSFPAARAAALAKMGLDTQILRNPNDILAVEYCKAILHQGTAMQPLPIRREGCYHAAIADGENPSATALRNLMLRGQRWQDFVPQIVTDIFANAPVHSLEAGEKAVLYRLRTMTDRDFEVLPYGSEGLWRKFMHASRSRTSLEDIIAATKSKRYTRSRLDRMVMCAFLGISGELLETPAPYTRVLALRDTGRPVLKQARQTGCFLNAGEAAEGPFWELEKRCGDLYGLFCLEGIGSPMAEKHRRICMENRISGSAGR